MIKIIYLHANWCRRCIFVWNEFYKTLIDNGYAEYIKSVDVDLEPLYIGMYRIEQLPTTIVLKDDEIIYKRVGGIEVDKIMEMVDDTG